MSTKATLSSFFRGDTKQYNLEFKEQNGAPINIVGHELWFTLKSNIDDSDDDAILQKKVVAPDGNNSENGLITIMLSSTDTESIAPGTYQYDIQKTIPGSPPIVATIMAGQIAVLADVTRSNA